MGKSDKRAGTLLAKDKGGNVRKPKPRREYAAIGPPPDDPLKRIEWMSELVAIAAYHVVNDTSLNEKDRRAELCKLSDRVAKLVPYVRLKKAEDLILSDREALFGDGDDQLDHATQSDSPTIRGTSKRGRKPKRPPVH